MEDEEGGGFGGGLQGEQRLDWEGGPLQYITRATTKKSEKEELKTSVKMLNC